MRPKGLRVSELIARLSRGQGSTPAATPTSPLRAEAATLKPRPEVPSPESPPDLCDRCTQLDFDGILSVPDESQLIGGEPKELARLGRRDELHDACTLCQFFTATLSIQRLNEKPEAAAGMSYSLYPMTTNLQPKYMSNTSTSPARQVYLMLAPSPDGTPYYWSSWPATYGYVMQVLPPSERPAYRTRALGSAIDFGVVRGWMETCYWMHPSHARRPEAHNVKRLRLLDCESSELVAAEPTAKYVALSYVWGDAKLYAMADVALNSYALDGDKLPNVLRDAITVVKRLGLRYIWIDRYCIAQKSEEDMKYHLGVMHTIYLNAEVTIIAAAGTDPSFGLPGVGKCPRTVQPSIKLGKHHLVFSYASVQEIVSLSKWSTRAWVFQEALFSRRRLVFTEQQVHFECDDMQCNETVDTCPEEFSRPRELGDYFGSNNTETIERSELKAKIMEYSKRQLSYDTDVLNAMMGIFNAYESLPKPTLNFYGVPIPQKGYGDVTSEFVLSLTWRHTRPARRRPFLPSWSWAGWAGEVEYFFRNSSLKVRRGVRRGPVWTLHRVCRGHWHENAWSGRRPRRRGEAYALPEFDDLDG